jgi:NAD(P)-dependent dehydrogenase (short-subunit alcohol dehydrogenase family)
VELSEADWDRVLAVNLKGAFLAMKEAIPVMLDQGAGAIVNISSIAALRWTGVPYATYYATKAALSRSRIDGASPAGARCAGRSGDSSILL